MVFTSWKSLPGDIKNVSIIQSNRRGYVDKRGCGLIWRKYLELYVDEASKLYFYTLFIWASCSIGEVQYKL